MLQQVPKLVQFWPRARDAKFSRDGLQVAVAVGNEAYVFKLATMDRIGPLPHASPVVAVYFTPAADRLVTLARDPSAEHLREPHATMGRIWDAHSGKPLTETKRLDDSSFGKHGEPPDIEFTPDGERLLAVNHHLLNRHYVRMSIHVFDSRCLELLSDKFAYHHNDEYLDFHLSPDRTRIFTRQGVPYTGKTVDEEDWKSPRSLPQSWDLMSGGPVFPPLDHPLDYTGDADYSPDGKHIVTSANDRVNVWDAQTGRLVREFKTQGSADVTFYADGKSLFVTGDGQTWWWEIATGELKYEWAHDGRFIVDPHGQSVVWNDKGNGESYIKNVTLKDSPEVRLPKHYSVAFSPDGSRLAFTPVGHYEAGDYVIRNVMDVRRSNDAFPLTPPWRFAGTLSHDGRYYLCVDDREDIGVWLWDLNTKSKLVQPFPDNRVQTIRDVAFSED